MGNSQTAAIAGGTVASIAVVASATGTALYFALRKKPPPKQLVDPHQKYALRVVDRDLISHDTIRLKLGLDSPEHVLGLPIGNHVYFSARINGEMVIRPYTPISTENQRGYVDFVIKVYKAGVNQNFPNGGKMSQYLMNIPLNQFIDVRGPSGNLHYKGCGVFAIKPDAASPPNEYKVTHVSMICGGSGITPMFQLLSHILDDPKDCTKLALLFANNTENDILLRDELEALRDKNPDQFKLWYTVTEAPPEWTYSRGYVDDKMISEHLYPPSDNSLVLLCGPPPMVEFACYPNLSKLNYSRGRIFTY